MLGEWILDVIVIWNNYLSGTKTWHLFLCLYVVYYIEAIQLYKAFPL